MQCSQSWPRLRLWNYACCGISSTRRYQRMTVPTMARFEDWVVSQWDMMCLSPRYRLTAEIVNISTAYLSDMRTYYWFLSARVSERARRLRLVCSRKVLCLQPSHCAGWEDSLGDWGRARR